MKTLLTICLIMATVFTVNAQDGKPTKEETVEFITAYFKDKSFKTDEFKDNIYRSSEYKNIRIDFDYNTSQMSFSYEYEGQFRSVKEPSLNKKTFYIYKNNFKINDIESVEKIVFSGNDVPYMATITFKAASGKMIHESTYEQEKPQTNEQLNSIEIPIEITYGTYLSEEAKKLQKALNHLRKLCGAPDPISFD